VPYFAYGTTQSGFVHHRALGLGEPAGRFRTVAAHSVVVPRDPACSNPGCRYKHRMAALVAGHWNHRAEGDVFLVEDFSALDALELSGPYVRSTVEVVPLEGGEPITAQTYPAAEPLRWAELVWAGLADALETYSRALADASPLKDCCVNAPGHEPPHDVLDPLVL
jgi:hypothetical protein